MAMIKLIIAADDFGYSKLFNKRILELVENESVTAVSVMVDEIQPDQRDQVQRLISLSSQRNVSVGLHTYFKNTNFEEEIERQVERFSSIFGFTPRHIDIHKVDYIEKGYPKIQEYCIKHNIPSKNLGYLSVDVMDKLITTRDSIYDGTGKKFNDIERWLNSLTPGYHSINFHPGYYDPASLSSLNKEREMDAVNIEKIIKNSKILDIELVSFNDLASDDQLRTKN